MGRARTAVCVAVVAALFTTAVALPPPSGSFGQPLGGPREGTLASTLAQGAQTPLPGHVLPALGQATPLARLAADGGQPITFSVVLRHGNEAGFQAFVQAANDPRSPSYRRFATRPGELADRFGPSQQTYDAVLGFLLQNGFILV